MNAFSRYHPLVNFLYFGFVISFSMFFLHPVCLVVSLLCAFIYSVKLNGRRALRFNLLYMLPMLLFAALINPAFNHEGATVITYLSSGNPLTLESIIYGLAAATMLVCVICWFSCFNAVITSDKFIYLFGKIIPALSLILSMVLRFVPKFKAQIKAVSNAQRCIGRDISHGSIIERAKHGITILSIMVSWSLENAVDTADSMKSRGYGLSGRTAFSIFTFSARDAWALCIIIVLGLYVIFGALSGGIYFRYFPTFKSAPLSPYSISIFSSYFLLCIMPVIIEVWEDKKWKAMQSTI